LKSAFGSFGSWLFWGSLLIASIFASVSQADFEVPKLTGPVVDRAGLIPPALEQSLDRAIRHLKAKGGSQLQVLTVKDLQGLPIEQASIQITDTWKLGTETDDNGVLLLVSLAEKKIRIEVGQGLEGVLTDAQSRRIIDTVIVPLFRSGHPESAILLGVINIVKKTDPSINLEGFFNGEGVSDYKTVQRKQSLLSRIFSFLFMFIMLIVFIRNPWLFLLIMTQGGGRRGGFGGGGGGWSGGGGGFSGGGASGGW